MLKNHLVGCDKSKAEWIIEGEINGQFVIATIYDYKNPFPIKKTTDWHIGGFDENALELIRQVLPEAKVLSYDEYYDNLRAKLKNK